MNDNSLVEGEGVNAGSGQQAEEGADSPKGAVRSTGDVRGGGHPQAADPEKDGVTKGDLDSAGPKQSHRSGDQSSDQSDGQDSGLME